MILYYILYLLYIEENQTLKITDLCPGPEYGQGPGYPPVYQQPDSHMMQPLATEAPQFAQPVMGSEGESWMGPVGEQMVPLNCPPGLEYLTMIDQLIIKQKTEMMEAIAGVMDVGFETANKYKIKNVLGQVSIYITRLEEHRCQIIAFSWVCSILFSKPDYSIFFGLV